MSFKKSCREDEEFTGDKGGSPKDGTGISDEYEAHLKRTGKHHPDSGAPPWAPRDDGLVWTGGGR